jgi:hypothetical protein
VTESDGSFFDDLRDFAAGEAAGLARLEAVLDAIRRDDEETATFDSDALWARLERQLGWVDPDQPADGR